MKQQLAPHTPVKIGNEWIMRLDDDEPESLIMDTYCEPLSEKDWEAFDPATFVPFAREQIVADAQSPEMRHQILDALQTWDTKISAAPLKFGKFVFELPVQGLEVRMAILPPLLVYFAVEQKTHKVFVKSMKWIGDGSTRYVDNPNPSPTNYAAVEPRNHYTLRFSSRAVHVMRALVAKIINPANRNGRAEEQIIEMALEDYAKRQGIVVEK
jgi:hypothetical protein